MNRRARRRTFAATAACCWCGCWSGGSVTCSGNFNKSRMHGSPWVLGPFCDAYVARLIYEYSSDALALVVVVLSTARRRSDCHLFAAATLGASWTGFPEAIAVSGLRARLHGREISARLQGTATGTASLTTQIGPGTTVTQEWPLHLHGKLRAAGVVGLFTV